MEINWNQKLVRVIRKFKLKIFFYEPKLVTFGDTRWVRDHLEKKYF